MERRKVLVIEDESLIARALTKILNKLQYEIIGIANEADVAMTMLEKQVPDIILMDIKIDGKLDGIQTAELVRSKYDIPIVYMSSLDDQATLDRAKETMPFGYVSKPFDEKDIKIILNMSLYKYEMDRKLRENEARYRSVVTSLNEGILLINSDLIIETCNPAAERILGSSANDLIGHNVLDKNLKVLSENNHRIHYNTFDELIALINRQPHYDILLKYINDKNEIVFLNTNFEPVLDLCSPQDKYKAIVCSFKDITSQINTESAYKSIVDNSIQGLIVIQDSDIIFANNTVQDILGYSPEELINFKVNDLESIVAAEYIDLLRAIFENDSAKSKKLRQILAVRKADGEMTWIELYSSHFTFRGKDALQFVFIDISDKKAAEQMLIDSEERFRSLFHNSYDGIAITDETGNITEWNKAMETITGLNSDVVKGMKIWDMQAMFSQAPINIDRRKVMRTTYDNFFKTGKAPWLDMLTEFNIQQHTGEVITVQQVSFKIKTRNGYLLCSMNRDISELMQSRKAQIESENRLRLAMEAVNDALWDLNPTTEEILYLSPKWFTLLGYSPNEYPHNFDTFMRFIHKEDIEAVKSKLQRITNATETMINVEFRMLAHNKRYKWMLARGKAINIDNNGQVNRLIGTNIDITERKKMEFAIKENEQTIRTLLDATNEPIGLFDNTGRIMAINQAAAMKLNRTQRELIGRNYFDYLPMEIAEKQKQEITQVIETCQFRQFIDSNSEKHIEYSFFPIPDAHNKVIGIAAYSKDLTQIFETQQQLTQSEERYRVLFEETPISHWIIDLSEIKEFLDKMKHIGVEDFESFIESLQFDADNELMNVKLIDVNNYTLELFEAQSKEEFTNNFCGLFLSDAFTSLKKLFVKLFQGQTRFEGENVMRTVKGNMIYAYWKFAIAPGYEKSWQKVLVSGIDISAKKKMEFALQESEKTLRAIIQASPIGIGMVKDRILLWANQPFFEVLGHKDKDLLNQSLTKLYQNSEEALIAGQKLYSQVNEFGLGSSELRFIKSNGTHVECLVMAKAIDPIAPDSGQILALMDITERKYNEEQKKLIDKLTIETEIKKNEAIQLIDKSALLASIGVIAGGITHEINQPLNAIRMGADGILYWDKQHHILPEMITEMMGGISEAANRIDEIIKHMRSFWIEPNKEGINPINLNTAIEKAVSLVSQKLQSSEIQLKIFSPEPELLVQANPIQLELIINNLIINASHSLNEAKAKDKWIKVNAFKDAKAVYLEISDNGKGLPEVDTQKLFDPFFSTRKPQEGTGLGLAIVKMFVDRFGAKVSARNLPGAGAIFTIQFSHPEEV